MPAKSLRYRHLTTFAAALGLSILSSAASADLRLSNEDGDSYTVQVMSWWEIPFRTVVRQQYDFSCGSAAVATLLTYQYGRRTPEQQVFAAMWQKGNQDAIRKAGFSMLDMKQYLDSIGYRTDGFRLTPQELAKTERPGIVLLNLKGYKHFVVVKGIRANKVLVGDPTLGLNEYPLKHFLEVWNGIYLAVRSNPKNETPKFNLASDWGPWSSAPFDDGQFRTSIGSLTNNLGPGYQISPQLILDLASLAEQK